MIFFGIGIAGYDQLKKQEKEKENGIRYYHD